VANHSNNFLRLVSVNERRLVYSVHAVGCLERGVAANLVWRVSIAFDMGDTRSASLSVCAETNGISLHRVPGRFVGAR
jgi:hypothetical protein